MSDLEKFDTWKRVEIKPATLYGTLAVCSWLATVLYPALAQIVYVYLVPAALKVHDKPGGVESSLILGAIALLTASVALTLKTVFLAEADA